MQSRKPRDSEQWTRSVSYITQNTGKQNRGTQEENTDADSVIRIEEDGHPGEKEREKGQKRRPWMPIQRTLTCGHRPNHVAAQCHGICSPWRPTILPDAAAATRGGWSGSVQGNMIQHCFWSSRTSALTASPEAFLLSVSRNWWLFSL